MARPATTGELLLQQNPQNANAPTAMCGQMPQASIQPAQQPQPQPIAQPPTTQHADLSAQTAQQIAMQQQPQQDPSQGSQSFHFSPSPSQNAPYAQNQTQPQNQAQSQVLQQIPPLLQQHVGQQNNGMVSTLYHNFTPGQHQMMQSQQLPQQQPAITTTEIYANGMMCHGPQQLQQPLAVLQVPSLYSRTTSASSTKSAPKVVKKKGRFRVVKGTASEVKKGRFVVKKFPVSAPPQAAEAVNAVEKPNTLGMAVMGKDNKGDNDSAVPPATSNLADTKSSTKKKGRFLVTTGSGEPTPETRSEATISTSKTSVEKVMEKSKIPGQAVKGTDNKGGNVSPVLTSTSNPADTKKPCIKTKGRFLVKTGNCAHPPAATETKSEAANNAIKTTDKKDAEKSKASEVAVKRTDKKGDHIAAVLPVTSKITDTNNPCTKKKGRFVVKTGNGAHPLAGKETEAGNAIKAMDKNDVKTSVEGLVAGKYKARPAAAGKDSKSDSASAVLPAASKLSDTQNPCTKKKGRFLVKTGGSALNLASREANPLPTSTRIPSIDKGVGTQNHVYRTNNENEESLKGNVSDVSSETMQETLDASRGVKKKGRFVIKTGAAAHMPLKTAILDAEVIQNNRIGESTYIRPYANPPAVMQTTTSLVDVNGNMITGMPTTTSLVDVNGHMMVLSNVPLAVSQGVQQHPLQQMPVAQCGQSSAASVGSQIEPPLSQGVQQQSLQQMPVAQCGQSSTASVGSQTEPTLQFNPCDAQISRSLQAPPSSKPRALIDERPPSNVHVPRPIRPAGGCGNCSLGGRASPLGGKHGRLIGAGGVGKTLHYLDTLRSEIIEADRSMASLQSDNRFLRDKNKEFEAKIATLERQLQAEQHLRCTAETKYRSLRNQVRFTDQGTDANQPQTQLGETKHLEEHQGFVSPSTESLVFLDDSISKPGVSSDSEITSTFPLVTQLDNGTASEMKLDNRESISFEDLQPNTAAVNSSLPTNTLSKCTTSDLARTHYISPSMTSLSTIAIQFDPLGTTPTPSVVPSGVNSVSNVEIPRLPPNPDDTKQTPITSNKMKIFDPLGTSEDSVDVVAAVASLGLGGLPPLPTSTLHHEPQQQQFSESNDEDPFNEIIQMRSI